MDDRFSERVPPSDLEAEQSVLAALLIDAATFDLIDGVVEPEDFWSDHHQRLFETMLALHARGDPVDIVTTQAALKARGWFESIGGLSYLLSLVHTLPTTANVVAYANIVAQRAALRRLQTAGRRVVDGAYQAEQVDELLEQAEADLSAVRQRAPAPEVSHLSQALVIAYDQLDTWHLNRNQPHGVPSGYAGLDRLTSGWQPSDLIIVAARPSQGKTALSLTLARAAAGTDRRCVFFSLEMPAAQLALRLLAAEAQVPSQRMRSGDLTDADWQRVAEAFATLSALPIWVDDTPNLAIGEIRRRVRRVATQGELGLVIIDYLQLIQASGHGRMENRQQEVSEISRLLKALARELRCPIIALSQVSRSCELRQDKRPLLSDLRESGALEQDSDLVVFLFNEGTYNPDSERKHICEVIIAKHRNGPLGTVDLEFRRDTGTFREHSPPDERRR